MKRVMKKAVSSLPPDQARAVFQTLQPTTFTENQNGIFLDLDEIPLDRLSAAFHQTVTYIERTKKHLEYRDNVQITRSIQRQELISSLKKETKTRDVRATHDTGGTVGADVLPEEKDHDIKMLTPIIKPLTKVQERLMKRCRELRPPARNRALLKSIVEFEDDRREVVGDPEEAYDDHDDAEDLEDTEDPEEDPEEPEDTEDLDEDPEDPDDAEDPENPEDLEEPEDPDDLLDDPEDFLDF